MVVIKDMDMPVSCEECRLMADGWCYAQEAWDHAHEDIDLNRRPAWCPLEDVEPVRYGQWILCDKQDPNDVANGNYLYECSECKFVDLHAKSAIVPYCWHCGVHMKDKTQRRRDE